MTASSLNAPDADAMATLTLDRQAIVIGGGIYGAMIALYLARERRLERVMLVEREPGLMRRASFNNQARVHNGYHYPRSFITAYRSRINYPRFLTEWRGATTKTFTKLYAIARQNSKVTAKHFERFCGEIGAKLGTPSVTHRKLFDSCLISKVYEVDECAFDAQKMKDWMQQQLFANGVDVRLYTEAVAAVRSPGAENVLVVSLKSPDGTSASIRCRYLFNCTYSALNQLRGDYPGIEMDLKHELTEMGLLMMPPALQDVGVTVMDGPFFSIMPFPARGAHTISHVRYTPHLSWPDDPGTNPYERLRNYRYESHVDRMIRDAARYIPQLARARYLESLYEIKTVLSKSDLNDGRPIVFEKHTDLPGCYSILGAKVDNVYDVLEKLRDEPLETY